MNSIVLVIIAALYLIQDLLGQAFWVFLKAGIILTQVVSRL